MSVGVPAGAGGCRRGRVRGGAPAAAVPREPKHGCAEVSLPGTASRVRASRFYWYFFGSSVKPDLSH